MKLEDIKRLLNAVELTADVDLAMEIEMIRASDLMSDVLTSSHAGDVLLTGLVNAQSVRTADVVDMSVIVFVRDKRPDDATIAMAQERNIHLLATSMPMFEACGVLFTGME